MATRSRFGGYEGRECNVSEMQGLTLREAVYDKDNEEIRFVSTDGRVFAMYHNQDCCESVEVESIVGDLQDLVGVPLEVAEEVNSEGTPAKDDYEMSFTWTFYKFRTIKGSVDIRWYGSSNGYYSESVTFTELKERDNAPLPTPAADEQAVLHSAADGLRVNDVFCFRPHMSGQPMTMINIDFSPLQAFIERVRAVNPELLEDK